MNYKLLSGLLAVLVIVLLALLVVNPPAKTNQPKIEQLNEKTPAGFPAEFVPPQGAVDMNNYTAKFQGRTDLNEQFMTAESPSAVVAYYENLFKASGWTARTVVDEPKNKVITATKGNLTAGLFVSVISGSDKSTQTQVRLSVSQTPAAGK